MRSIIATLRISGPRQAEMPYCPSFVPSLNPIGMSFTNTARSDQQGVMFGGGEGAFRGEFDELPCELMALDKKFL